MNTNVSKRAALSTVERMDRLPISSIHYEMTAVLGLVVFFELCQHRYLLVRSSRNHEALAPVDLADRVITSATFVGCGLRRDGGRRNL